MATVSGISRLSGRRPAGWVQFAVIVVTALMAGASNLSAQAPRITEYQVKAAYLANFSRFVEWPDRTGKNGSFNICVLGEDPLGAHLDAAVAGETIGRVPMAVKRISRPQDAVDCRILFISSSVDGKWKEILAALQTWSVLTVSDMPQFARRGGMVQFVLEGNKVRFEVNLAATGPPGLKLSSELLKLAVNVRNSP
jgi:hypothetical protein